MQRFDCLAEETEIFGPHFLEASAGTGKTFAIEQVVARLLLSGEMVLEQILVVTFTKAATRELKLRIHSNLERLGDSRAIQEALALFDQCQIFTIHGFCARMLAEFGLEANIMPASDSSGAQLDAGMYDFLESGLTADLLHPAQLNLLLRWAGSMEELVHLLKTKISQEAIPFRERQAAFRKAWEQIAPKNLHEDWQAIQGNYKKVKGDLEGQIEALATGDFAKLIEEKGSIFQFLASDNKKVRAKDPLFLHNPTFFDRSREILWPHVQSAIDPKQILNTVLSSWKPIERKILLETGGFSHDELLYAMQRAVAIESFRSKIQQKYRAVLIDEFQDTDPVQWDIFAKLFLTPQCKALYMIGDPKQSIYRFRSADLYTYLRAKDAIDPDRHFHLDTNFRSSKELISALNHLFDRPWLHLPREKTTLPYIPVRAGREIQTSFQDGKGAVHCVLLPKDDLYAYVASELMSLPKTGWRDFAVLVKDRYEAAEMERVLTSVGIPSRSQSHERLSDTLAFEAVWELLQAVASPNDLGLARRVLAGPLGGLSAEEVKAVEGAPFQPYRTILEEKGLAYFFQAFFKEGPTPDVSQVLEALFDWEMKMGFSFQGVFRFFQTLVQQDPDEAVLYRKEEGEDEVQIMTVHKSKGLEFEVVFALGLASKTPAGDEEVEAEKLRQLYVAMTRAKQRLYVPMPLNAKDVPGKTDAPIELFCKSLSADGKWKEELERIGSIASLTIEEVKGPIPLRSAPLLEEAPAAEEILPLPPFQPSYLLSFTALAKNSDVEPLEPLPEGDVPRGAETGVLIHRIFERLFSETALWKLPAAVTRIVKEELAGHALAFWETKIEQMIQASLDLKLSFGFCLRDLDAKAVRAEVEFLFEANPHFLKGFIDLVFRHDGQYYFIDWKTNWLTNYESETLREAMMGHRYDLQASIYAEALRKSGLPARAIYLFVRGPEALCFEPTEGHGRV